MTGSPNAALSTTAAVVLDQLARGDVSAYELVKRVRTELRYVWPRAESRIYAEAKRLVAAGLAASRADASGSRPRALYSITPAGREALSRWRGLGPGGISLENEPLLRVLVADEATAADLLPAIGAIGAHARTALAEARAAAARHLDGTHPDQAEVHLQALYLDYLISWARMQADWAARTEREMGRWVDTAPNAAKHQRALTRLRNLVGRAADR